jgi:hypothetical protein
MAEPKHTPTGAQINLDDPSRNMFGIAPCPKCGSRFRWPTRPTHSKHPNCIVCDDCDHTEPVQEPAEPAAVAAPTVYRIAVCPHCMNWNKAPATIPRYRCGHCGKPVDGHPGVL